MNKIIDFSKALAARVQSVTGYNVFHVPTELTPQTDVYGYVLCNTFEYRLDFSSTGTQPVGGSIILYSPALNNGLAGSQYGFEKLMDLADSRSDESLMKVLNDDRTVSGTCTGFLALSMQIQPLPDPDPEYSTGTVWVVDIPFQAMV